MDQNQQQPPNPPLHATPVTSFDPKDVEDNKYLALLSYIGILCLVPLLGKKDSKFCQEHGKQGLVLFLFEIAVMVLGMVPVIGWLAIGPIGSLLALVLSIVGIVNVFQGKFWEIPVLGAYRNKINL